jgi:CO/xanthine dehydrogenase Mo-binding subunit
MPRNKARFVGEPVAMVVAETVDQAKDAAELIAIAYEPLPAVVWAADALKPGAPLDKACETARRRGKHRRNQAQICPPPQSCIPQDLRHALAPAYRT